MSEELLKDKEEQKQHTKPPSMYHVILLNDDYTPMDFVVAILECDFRMSHEDAERTTYEIHQNGEGIAGTYTKDIAETKAMIAGQKAKEAGYPLLFQIREV